MSSSSPLFCKAFLSYFLSFYEFPPRPFYIGPIKMGGLHLIRLFNMRWPHIVISGRHSLITTG